MSNNTWPNPIFEVERPLPTTWPTITPPILVATKEERDDQARLDRLEQKLDLLLFKLGNNFLVNGKWIEI